MTACRYYIPAVVLSAITLCAQSPAVLRIGAGLYRTHSDIEREFTPLVRYLEKAMPGHRFELVPALTTDELLAAALNRRVDFVYATSTFYLILDARIGVKAIATGKTSHFPGVSVSSLGSAVLVPVDSPVAKLADLRGKRIAALDSLAMAGWLAAAREFKSIGIDPNSGFSQVAFRKSFQGVMEALQQGQVDAAILPSNALAHRVRTGLVDLAKLRVLPPPRAYPELKSYPFPSSTRLYPQSPFMKLPHTPDWVADKVAVALLTMTEASVSQSTLGGWTVPLSYQSVRECMAELGIDPYQNVGLVGFGGAFRQHWGKIVALPLAVAILCAAIIAYIWRSNRKLRASAESARADLNEHKRAEERLANHVQMLTQSHEATVAIDRDRKVTFWNQAASSLLGRSSEEVEGCVLSKLIEAPDGGLKTLMEGTDWSGEVILKNGHGATLRVDASTTVLRDASGTPMGNIIRMRDMTAIRNSEEEVLQSEKLESIGRLAGGVAQGFNSLLTVINGNSRLILNQTGLAPQHRSLLEQTLRAGESAAALTKQLLALGRKQTGEPLRLDLNHVLDDMLEMVRNLVGERIVVNLKLSPAPAMVRADPNQLLQIVTNVVTNAADAMPEGGKLDIETSSVALGIRDGPLTAGRYAQILISDTGRGMDEDTRRRLFEPFFTTKGTGKGTGLSLAAAYGVVRQSGGDIRVVSVAGHGTTFRILFPLVEHSQSAAEKPSTATVTDQTGAERRHILIVDDEADIRAFLRSALEPEGYEISEAGDGRQAVSIVRASPIDLVVTDLVMPAQEGLETIQQIRQSGHNTRIIAISGAFGGRYLRTADLIGADATLPKPVDPVVLIDTVRSVLSRPHRSR